MTDLSDDEEFNDIVSNFKNKYIDTKKEIKKEEDKLISNILKNTSQKQDYNSAIYNILKSTSKDLNTSLNQNDIIKVNSLLNSNIDINKLNNKCSLINNSNRLSEDDNIELIKKFYHSFYNIEIDEIIINNFLNRLESFEYVSDISILCHGCKVLYLSIVKKCGETIPYLKYGYVLWRGDKSILLVNKTFKWYISNKRPLFIYIK